MRIPFNELETADLFVGAVCVAGTKGTLADEPLPKLLKVGNLGGFRIAGEDGAQDRRVVLYTTGTVPEWPDRFIEEHGVFVYFGDNNTPGNDLHGPKGNQALSKAFQELAKDGGDRSKVPPFFVFQDHPEGRSAVFRGLAVPGTSMDDGDEDLVAVWRTIDGEGFLNYRARFTLLDAPVIRRRWLDSLVQGEPVLEHAPLAWQIWIRQGVRIPLRKEWAQYMATEG